MNRPQAAAASFALAPGAEALPGSLLWLSNTRSVVAADVHLAYEDVIGGALPLWSTPRSVERVVAAAQRLQALEIVLLGDIIHGSRMSQGAANTVATALGKLRTIAQVTLVAGNHEGRTRGEAVLGETHEAVERDGWLLSHGDVPASGVRSIVGHLHPALPLAAGSTIPVFLSGPSLIVVPALTPYSSGLNVLSSDCTEALHAFVSSIAGMTVVASDEERVYPFGSLGALRGLMAPSPQARRLRPESA